MINEVEMTLPKFCINCIGWLGGVCRIKDGKYFNHWRFPNNEAGDCKKFTHNKIVFEEPSWNHKESYEVKDGQ
jgi:hypothetical protein